MSAMICVQYGPITIAVRSTTRTPASGPSCRRSAMRALPGLAIPKLNRMWSAWPSGTTGNTTGGSDVSDRGASVRRPPRSTTTAGSTPGLSAMTARATRPASAMSISPDRTGFVREPTHRGRDEFRIHRRIGRGVDPLGHPRHRGRHDHVALHPVRGALDGRDVGQPEHAGLGGGVVGHVVVAVQAADRRGQHDAPVTGIAHDRKRGRTTWNAPRRCTSSDRVEVLVAHLPQTAAGRCRRCGSGCRCGRSARARRTMASPPSGVVTDAVQATACPRRR